MRSSPQGLARSSLLDAESALSAHPGMTVYSIMPGTRVRLCRPEHKPCAGHPRLRDLAAIKTWMGKRTLKALIVQFNRTRIKFQYGEFGETASIDCFSPPWPDTNENVLLLSASGS